MTQINAIPIYTDNYVWVISDQKDTWLIDPGLAQPVIDYLEANALNLKGILITHGHWDHVDGIAEIVERYQVPVWGPDSPRIPCLSKSLKEGDKFEAAGLAFTVMETPGHVPEHIVFYSESQPTPLVFTGDTLFALGCGRLLGGTIEDHFNSLQRLGRLPETTRVFCTHEYTESNLKFALTVEANNEALQQRAKTIYDTRSKGLSTIPTTIGTELKTNPFLRCHIPEVIDYLKHQKTAILNNDLERFTALRTLKDQF